jgi:valyl-tRNA synthetase
MSKSKGNIIDPVEMIDAYGCDALRFTLAALAAPGRDIKLSPARVEGYRNFATKLWNAARFCEMNDCTPRAGFDPAECEATVNRWIVGALAETGRAVTRAIEEYRFNDAANALYHFVWGTFCDWYLEIIKPILAGNEAPREETQAACAFVLDQTLHLLHPIMPFLTEELWEKLRPERANRLISAEWPRLDEALVDAHAAAEMDWLVRLVSEIRSIRADYSIPPAQKIDVEIIEPSSRTLDRLSRYEQAAKRMGGVERFFTGVSGSDGRGTVQFVLNEATIRVYPKIAAVQRQAEMQRLSREISKLEDEIEKLDKKLSNPSFLAKAPPEVVDEQRERRTEAAQAKAKLDAALGRLSAL